MCYDECHLCMCVTCIKSNCKREQCKLCSEAFMFNGGMGCPTVMCASHVVKDIREALDGR